MTARVSAQFCVLTSVSSLRTIELSCESRHIVKTCTGSWLCRVCCSEVVTLRWIMTGGVHLIPKRRLVVNGVETAKTVRQHGDRMLSNYHLALASTGTGGDSSGVVSEIKYDDGASGHSKNLDMRRCNMGTCTQTHQPKAELTFP